MAATTDKNRCAICNKEKATLRCGGCSKDFCFSHVADHRQELCKQLDELEVTRDLFRQTLTEQGSQPQKHPLIKQIDKWERESINKIQQTAEEARQLLIQHTTGRIIEIETQVIRLTDQLRKSREEDDFFETDLSRWKKEIARLTETLNRPPSTSVRQDSAPLVTRIVVDVHNGEPESKVGQPNIDQYFEPNDRRSDRSRPNNEDLIQKKPKVADKKPNNQSKSKVSVKYGSDDDDNENKPQQRHTGPVTRSSTSLPKLRITFENSDDENDDSRYSSWAQDDIAQYRSNYPHARSNPKITDNYDFYTNKIRSHPDGDFIDNIHKDWFGDYRKIEYHDGCIEWLFPLQEKGLNWSAEPLQKHEIESIKKDEKALKRILKSYKLMLDFYGFELIDDKTGELRRLPDGAYKEQFDNLNTSSHNYLRITRILKCLGEFDYEYLKFPFLAAILRESITENTLSNCLPSCKDYWIGTLRSQKERQAIRQYARELREYRNKEISPPKSHRAERPASSTSTPKVRKVLPGKNNNDNNSNE